MIALRKIGQSGGELEGKGLAVAGMATGGLATLLICLWLALMWPAVQGAREAAQRMQCRNHLKQLGLAMHSYRETNGHLPAAASYDAGGKKLLSWRVHILPYLEEGALYKQFHLDEPWDSEHNRKLIDKMPATYTCPSTDLRQEGMTTYLAPLGDQTVFSGKEGITFQEITDGTSNTILLVEADSEHAVIWTKPDDLEIDLENPKDWMSGQDRIAFHAVFCDGSVHTLSKGIDAKVLGAMFTRNDGLVIDFELMRLIFSAETDPASLRE